MTELQLRIRRLTHKAARLRKLRKDTAVVVAELAELRQRRAEEKAGPKADAPSADAGAVSPDCV